MEELMIKIDNVSKEYRLGQIGGTTLRDELQRVMAKIRKKEDPTKRIGAKDYNKGEKFRALDGISFEVKQGERIGIIGHNGAGKSTLLKLLSRVTAPTEGSISLNGRIASMLEVGTGFHPELTGRENIYMNGAILGMKKKEIDSKIENIIEFSEVRQFIDTPVKRYSSGMYVKLAFAVAAHLDSEIMIMDEVLAVGDMKFQQKCLNKMRDISLEEGRTILYVSHNMNTIRQLCNRCIVLNHGKLIYDGEIEQAIKIYLDNNDDSVKRVWKLQDAPRPFKMHGVKARISELEFVNSNEGCIFNAKEPVLIKIKWKANTDMENARFLFEIKSADGINVGGIETEPLPVAKKGEEYECTYKLDISVLAEGRYYFVVDMYNLAENGVHTSYDHIMMNIFFDVLNTEPYARIWEKQYFGYTRLKRAPLIEVSDENN